MEPAYVWDLMDLLRPVVFLILIDPLWWKNELILPISPGFEDSAITSKKPGNRFAKTAHREQMGLDFIGHGVMDCQGRFVRFHG